MRETWQDCGIACCRPPTAKSDMPSDPPGAGLARFLGYRPANQHQRLNDPHSARFIYMVMVVSFIW